MALVIADAPIPLTSDTHGVFRVSGTRITLDTLIAAFEGGATVEEIVQQYPSLDPADVYAVIGYYLHHLAEVAAYLRQRQEQAAATRQENQAHFDSTAVRERLLARRGSTGS